MIPLTPDNIDRITDMIFREFNWFSDELSHVKIKEVAPLFIDYITGTKDIISYLSEVFDRYYILLSKIVNIELINYGLIASAPMSIKYTDEVNKLVEYEKVCAFRPKIVLDI